jgi:hypothetical protein
MNLSTLTNFWAEFFMQKMDFWNVDFDLSAGSRMVAHRKHNFKVVYIGLVSKSYFFQVALMEFSIFNVVCFRKVVY